MRKKDTYLKHSVENKLRIWFADLAFCTLLLLVLSPMSFAQEDNAGGNPALGEQITQSIERALTSYQAEMEDLQINFQKLESFQREIIDQLKAYDVQSTIHIQLLLIRSPRQRDLENALRDNRLAIQNLNDQIETLRKNWEMESFSVQDSMDRIEQTRKQVDDIQRSWFSDAQKQQIESVNQKLNRVFQERKEIEHRYLIVYGDLLNQIQEVLEKKEADKEKLTRRIKEQRERILFQKQDLYRFLSGAKIKEELRLFQDRIAAVFKPTTWKGIAWQIEMGGRYRWLVLLSALTVIIVMPHRLKAPLKKIETRLDRPQQHYRQLCLFLLRRSMPLLGLALLFKLYGSVGFSLLDVGLGHFLYYLFLTLLFTRYALDFLDHGFKTPTTELRTFVFLRLKPFFWIFRAIMVSVLVILLIAGSDSILAWMAWTVASFGFLSWMIVFWREMKSAISNFVRHGQSVSNRRKILLVAGWTYLFFGGNLLLNMLGYQYLAGELYRMWVESFVLLFWAWLGFKTIGEWQQEPRTEEAVTNEDRSGGQKWQWSRFLPARLILFFGLLTGMIWVWDPSGATWNNIWHFFKIDFTIGSLKISIDSIAMAILLLIITAPLVRFSKGLLEEKLLTRRQLERGLKDSILTITGYVGWGVGIMLALGIVGVNATSLAVAFGALSIGISFGLQNIFNNFISGLILLLERPIQVGDYVEVNGLWAEVKRINVRSTTVRTFDNATVIIPNSELISQNITNWSFQDPRMRLHVDVGVAYGSDIELVRNTLLAIPTRIDKVLKYPRPDVLFMDHGDSALIFRLRFWAHVKDYNVVTDVRFELDHHFRELGIEIAFPQRDLHIRSVDNSRSSIGTEIKTQPPKGEGSNGSRRKVAPA